mmetsp:Transcript_40599/g.120364  ORF Transcript_40599/g.120364 Transcript_40599/m.120364 type:complete len:250 (-) Transcript_40599:1431-2180(-)
MARGAAGADTEAGVKGRRGRRQRDRGHQHPGAGHGRHDPEAAERRELHRAEDERPLLHLLRQRRRALLARAEIVATRSAATLNEVERQRGLGRGVSAGLERDQPRGAPDDADDAADLDDPAAIAAGQRDSQRREHPSEGVRGVEGVAEEDGVEGVAGVGRDRRLRLLTETWTFAAEVVLQGHRQELEGDVHAAVGLPQEEYVPALLRLHGLVGGPTRARENQPPGPLCHRQALRNGLRHGHHLQRRAEL